MLNELQLFELYKQSNPNELTARQLMKVKSEIANHRIGTMSDEYFDFLLWSRHLPSRQENFAKFLSRKLKTRHSGAKILEVGCGRTARLSRLLSNDGFKMTAIDPRLEIKNSKGITLIKDYFDYRKFDVSDFDFVIGQEPCEATEHVVIACTMQNVPFMMTLCGVPHKLISGETPEDVYEWYDYLVNLNESEIRLRYVELDPIVLTPILKSRNFK